MLVNGYRKKIDKINQIDITLRKKGVEECKVQNVEMENKESDEMRKDRCF